MISVTEYHQRTKHSLQRYARGPETLDWDDQPDPFRRFNGCEVFPLPAPGRELEVRWSDLDRRSAIERAPLTLENVGLLLELAFGLSAWKQFGPDRWALRCNPSSGNLHPSEAYLINGARGLLPRGVYHYVSYDHHLEQRCVFDDVGLHDTLLLGLSSVHWREAWKYGERAFRYCQLDAGHALAALNYAAALLGWRIEWLGYYSDDEIARLAGIDRDADFIDKERESPDWLCRICYKDADFDPLAEKSALLQAVENGSWRGKAQSLRAYHMYHWPVIDEVSTAARNDGSETASWVKADAVNVLSSNRIPATQLIRQRRSAQHFNGLAPSIGGEHLLRILDAVRPADKPPFDGWNWASAVHLGLFVHKVEGLTPGIYAFPRSEQGLACLKNTLNAAFGWQPLAEFPGLYLLHEADVRKPAKTLSCHQAIAADSAFSLAMLAEFRGLISMHPWHYRRLFWECGLVGQILYLEAEAAGLRGTGIGCFFDDEVHGVLGIRDDTLQSLYHFTVGEPLEDNRLQTLPAYAHLSNELVSR